MLAHLREDVALVGQDLRSVATSLGRASVNTTMGYTEQDAIDLIEIREQNRPVSE